MLDLPLPISWDKKHQTAIFKFLHMHQITIKKNKMKPTNPNADTYVEEQKQYL